MTRRALVVEQPGSLGLAVYESLEPGPGEVVARTVFCGLCGSDLELYRGEVDPAFVRYPLTLGHEWSGVVESVGPGVSGLEPGQRCVAEGIIPCGHCRSCLRGATNVCETYDEIGFTREGAAGDQLLLPARIVHGLADDVSLVDAALVEPAAVVLTGLEKARPAEGARVLVVGDGTIGLLAAMLAGLWSPVELVMVGGRQEQQPLARLVGVTSFGLVVPPDDAFDLVIEAAGSPTAVESAVSAARRGGTVLLLGLPPTGTTVTFPADLLVNNDLTVVASFGYTSSVWARVVELLNTRRIPLGALVTHRYPLEAYDEAFEALTAPTGARGKILLEVSGG